MRTICKVCGERVAEKDYTACFRCATDQRLDNFETRITALTRKVEDLEEVGKHD